MSRIIRRTMMLLVLASVIVAVVWAIIPKPIDVDTALVERSSLRLTVDEDGRTRIRERYVVSAPLAGRLQRIMLDPGDKVAAEESTLALIEPTDPMLLDVRAMAEAEARVHAAEAAVRRNEALVIKASETLEYHRRERERMQAALERDAARQRELDATMFAENVAVQELHSARFERDISTFELQQAQAALLRTRGEGDDLAAQSAVAGPHFAIRSPINGCVLRIFQESMAVVAAGTPLLEVGDPHDLEVVVDVLSRDAARIQPGATVYIDGWGGDHELLGIVRRVEPSAFTKVSALGVEEQRVNIVVDFVSPVEQRRLLGDAFRVDAHIVLWESDDILVIPMSALYRQGDQWGAFVVQGGRARERAVQVGRSDGRNAEVVAGLSEGEMVIVHPGDMVEGDVRVKVRR